MIRGAGKVKGYLSYLKSPEFIAVASAIILTPILSSFLVPLVGRIPVLGSYPLVTVIVASLILFWIAKAIGGMYTRAILVGVAGGMIITAFMGTSIGQNFVGRISATVGSATG